MEKVDIAGQSSAPQSCSHIPYWGPGLTQAPMGPRGGQGPALFFTSLAWKWEWWYQVLPQLWLKYSAVKLLLPKPACLYCRKSLGENQLLPRLQWVFSICTFSCIVEGPHRAPFWKSHLYGTPAHLHGVLLMLLHSQHAAHNWHYIYTLMAWFWLQNSQCQWFLTLFFFLNTLIIWSSRILLTYIL